MLNLYLALELARLREAELTREMEMLRLAGPGRISRALRRLVATAAMRPDREAGLSRFNGGRSRLGRPAAGVRRGPGGGEGRWISGG